MSDCLVAFTAGLDAQPWCCRLCRAVPGLCASGFSVARDLGSGVSQIEERLHELDGISLRRKTLFGTR